MRCKHAPTDPSVRLLAGVRKGRLKENAPRQRTVTGSVRPSRSLLFPSRPGRFLSQHTGPAQSPGRIQCDHRVTTGVKHAKTTKPQVARKPGLTWGFVLYTPWDLNPEPAD